MALDIKNYSIRRNYIRNFTLKLLNKIVSLIVKFFPQSFENLVNKRVVLLFEESKIYILFKLKTICVFFCYIIILAHYIFYKK